MGVGVYAFFYKLEVVADPYFCGFASCKQSVIIPFAPAYAVALTVVCDCWHYYQFNIVDVGSVVACRLLYLK